MEVLGNKNATSGVCSCLMAPSRRSLSGHRRRPGGPGGEPASGGGGVGTQDDLISSCKCTPLISANYDVNKGGLAGRGRRGEEQEVVEGVKAREGVLVRCGDKPKPPTPHAPFSFCLLLTCV